MKYSYAYKSSNGERHEATLEAPSREAVFATLRQQGIKPIKVVAADGSKANGEVRGIRKRVVVLGALCLVLSAVIAAVIAFRVGDAQGTRHNAQGTLRNAQTTSPRHQIYGDPAIVEAIEHGKTEAWLPRRGDQLLAWFAQPGKLACPKNTSQNALYHVDSAAVSALEAIRTANIPLAPGDAREIRELKQIVNGMRVEMQAYLANGNGTIRSFWRRLIERMRQESQIYERTKRELAHETNPTVWDAKNEALRNLGLRTLPTPQEGE